MASDDSAPSRGAAPFLGPASGDLVRGVQIGGDGPRMAGCCGSGGSRNRSPEWPRVSRLILGRRAPSSPPPRPGAPSVELPRASRHGRPADHAEGFRQGALGPHRGRDVPPGRRPARLGHRRSVHASPGPGLRPAGRPSPSRRRRRQPRTAQHRPRRSPSRPSGSETRGLDGYAGERASTGRSQPFASGTSPFAWRRGAITCKTRSSETARGSSARGQRP